MKKIYLIIGVVVIILIVAITTVKMSNTVTAPTKTTPSSSPIETSDLKISAPVPGKSFFVPGDIMISGEAKGSWFFEGTFPVQLKDTQGKVISTGQARAIGDWMTTDFVSFTAQLDARSVKEPMSAIVIFSKDNPSGLPQNDVSVELPIQLVVGVM